jgi:isoleucyl-tRNA synthetase
VQYVIADGLTRLLAPILSITAEEVWGRLPGARDASVHLALFPADTARFRNEDLDARWSRLLDVRRIVYAALETARNAKVIGASLTAHVTVTAPGDTYELLKRHEADLAMLFIVSSVSVERRDGGPDVQVDVARAAGDKCPRCWRIVGDAAADGDLAGLCARCVTALGGNPVAAAR